VFFVILSIKGPHLEEIQAKSLTFYLFIFYFCRL